MKARLAIACLVTCALGSAASPARAQGLLPRGVGAAQLGYRSYGAETSAFDASGGRTGIGAGFDKNFSGNELLQSGNGDLRRLAGELQNYERGLGGAQSLVRDLSLGKLRGDVKANVSARILGFGYGVTSRVTLFAGVPWVSARVRADLHMEGENNALAVRDRLGSLAFDELKSGLTRAAALNAATIKQSIAAAGYKPIDDWSHDGFGDTRLGARTAFETGLGRGAAILGTGSVTALLPTGTPDDPDALTDVKTGNGYYGLELAAGQRVMFQRTFYAGTDAAYTLNFDADAQRRVPEAGESIVAADRKASVRLNPGDDTDVSGYVGARRWGVDLSYRLGTTRHFSDSYRGSMAGDYAALGHGSDKTGLYQKVALAYDTVGAYKARRFPLPFVVALSAGEVVAGRNATQDRFYELAMTGFFATALAR